MKKHYFILYITLAICGTINAQNLVFDNAFNNNGPHSDGAAPPDISMYDQGNLRQLNDSVFIYYRNDANWTNEEVLSEVLAKTIHQDGSVTVDLIYSQQYSYGFYGPEIYTITDVVTTTNRVFIIRNEAYDFNGTLKKGIHVNAYDYSGGSFMPSMWASGGGSIQPTPNIFNAKGAMLGTYLTLAFQHSLGSDPIQLASTTVGSVSGAISYGGINLLTSNPQGTSSSVADILAFSANEIYIADNASVSTGSGYNDMARIIKYNPTTFTLSSDYNVNGTGHSAYMNWNTQTSTPNVQDHISGIAYYNGKIIVVGHYNHYDGSPYSLNRGRITRLNTNGTIDNTFAPGGSITGTFAPGFSNDYFRWSFTDIDVKSDGKLFVSAYGTYGNSGPINPVQCFFLQLDADGNLDTNLGNNGRLFESQSFGVIKETIIVQGITPSADKFVFNGINVIDPDPNFGYGETAMGRLVWSNGGGTSNVEEQDQTSLILYPNPTNSVLNIELSSLAMLQIVTSDGKALETLSGSLIYQYDLSHLESGIYYIKVENGITQKFIKQ